MVHRGRYCASVAFVLLVTGAAQAQTILDPGDVALVGIYFDDLSGSGGSSKAFAFVSFVAMEAGTVVSFTDNGWLSPEGRFRIGEGSSSFTVSSPGLAAGSVITLPGAVGNFNLSTVGDQVFAFQGTIDGAGGLTGVLLWGLNNEGAGVWQSTATGANDSALPPPLAFYNLALPELDNYSYAGPLSGTVAELQAAIRTPGNWVGNDTMQLPFPAAFDVQDPDLIFSDGFENGA